VPAEYFHVACARDALSTLPALPFEIDSASFALGCQGPDIFSHNRRTKPLSLAYARLLHRREYGTFSGHLAALLSRSGVRAQSWFLGFLTHAAVDRTVHPYIISKSCPLPGESGPDIDRARLHAFFERILDDALEGYRGIDGEGVAWHCAPVRIPAGLPEALAEPVAESLTRTYGDKAGDRVAERVLNAFADAGRVFALTAPDRGRSVVSDDLARLIGYGPDAVALLRPVGLRERADWLNLEREAWPEPVTGELRRESVPDLASLAAERAAAALIAGISALTGEREPSALAALIGNQCLSACGDGGLPAPARYSAPFDLTPFLLQQTELRQAQVLRGTAFG